ncbi:MAG: hypothetical protein LBE24_03950 [Methylobacillus sp.]|jgi:DNA anti-recombination protein RmuC|nr:hypothetical protein [Methylobacillus sp.]
MFGELKFAAIASLAALIIGMYAGWQIRDWQADSEALKVQEATNQKLQAEIRRVADLQNKLRAQEREAGEALMQAETDRQKEIENVRKTKDATIAALRSDLVKLRDPWAGDRETACGSTQTPETAGTVLPDRTGELSNQLAEYLVSEAARADAIVVELNACRRVAVDQNAACNRMLVEAFR